jgi:DNA-binding Lrp family transcriptional regulator
VADLTQSIIHAIQGGLPLTPRPFALIAENVGTDEQTVIDTVRDLQARGVIKRFGVVVRHLELGFRANAMVVLDVPDESVTVTARRLALDPAVTLCYRRPRRLPDWPYNLFCMVHGQDRRGVEKKISALRLATGIHELPFCVLFSRRRFKQRGACYVSPDGLPDARPASDSQACANG